MDDTLAIVLARQGAEAAAGGGLEEALKAFALEKLAAYKHPRRVLVLDSFPRTHLGKVDRGALRAKLKEALA